MPTLIPPTTVRCFAATAGAHRRQVWAMVSEAVGTYFDDLHKLTLPTAFSMSQHKQSHVELTPAQAYAELGLYPAGQAELLRICREHPAEQASIKIGSDGRCCCDGATSCPLGRIGAELRCTRGELHANGIPTHTMKYAPQRAPEAMAASLAEVARRVTEETPKPWDDTPCENSVDANYGITEEVRQQLAVVTAERNEYIRQCQAALDAAEEAKQREQEWFAAKVNTEAERDQLKAVLRWFVEHISGTPKPDEGFSKWCESLLDKSREARKLLEPTP